MSYRPNRAAIPSGTSFTRQLSQRDLSLQIPVNFVTLPGVVLQSACFPDNRYEDSAAQECFSNLLAVGFRRFDVDLYWDLSRRVWSLCPVELGGVNAIRAPEASPARTTGSAILRARQETETTAESLTVASTDTQVGGTPLPSVSTTSTLGAGSTAPSYTAPASDGTGPSETLLQVGPYSCTTSMNFELITRILASHLDETQTNVNATVKYLVMNLHVAAPASNPYSSPAAPSSDDLPQGRQLLSSILTRTTSDYLYTAGQLEEQRSGLNASGSWFNVVTYSEPDPAYFTVRGSGEDTSTPDGWPSESYIEMQRAQRLLAGFGRIDPQIQSYDFPGDAAVIFSRGYLQSQRTVTISDDGDIETGCFFDEDQFRVSQVNNSWAITTDDQPVFVGFSTDSPTFEKVGNLTRCGITPVLNETLRNATADQNYRPYFEYVQDTIWSWAPDEPRNSRGLVDQEDDKTENRCAVMDATTGNWKTVDCTNSYYSACRRSGEPYKWTISDSDASYTEAGISCQDDTEFTAPRTALENTYLLNAWREAISARDLDDNNNLLWINFNDLDIKGCWVVGQNTTCPYLRSGGSDGTVVVPTVAAVIVFVLAALTVFIKCVANRQSSKRQRQRRKGDYGWDYEGVPS